jgi:hypothetical protein
MNAIMSLKGVELRHCKNRRTPSAKSRWPAEAHGSCAPEPSSWPSYLSTPRDACRHALSALFTQSFSICPMQPILGAIDRIVAQRDGCSVRRLDYGGSTFSGVGASNTTRSDSPVKERAGGQLHNLICNANRGTEALKSVRCRIREETASEGISWKS